MRRWGLLITTIACLLTACGMLLVLLDMNDAALRSNFVGTWDLTGMAWDETSSDLHGSAVYLELRSDGSATYVERKGNGLHALGTSGDTFTWEASTPNTATIDMGDTSYPMLVNGDRLTVETESVMLSFERAGTSDR